MKARVYTVAEIFSAHRVGRLELSLTVDNLLNTRWNEAQFATTSRLHEPSKVTELNYTPGASRSIQLGAELRF